MRGLATLAVVALGATACSGTRAPTEGGAPTGASARPSASAASSASSGARSNPRAVRVSSEGKPFLDLREGAGVLVDGNAPPPPPGSTPARHPFLSGSCYGGRPALCSKAKALLDASRSFDEVIEKLRADGLTVEER